MRLTVRSRAALFVAVLAVTVSLVPATARAETIDCTAITTVPYTITVGGVYCLTGDLSTAITAGSAITINANNVVLDLNGHKVGGLAAGAGTLARGINANLRQNITIKNGTVRGFYYGILLEDGPPYTASQGHVIEDMRLDQNTFVGVGVFGRGTVIRNNQVVATGGTTVFPSSNAIGIHVIGPANQVIDNDVMTLSPVGAGTGRGIYFQSVTDALAVNNRITDADKGIEYFTTSTGKYRDNLTAGVTTPFVGGTDAGNNN